jgi:hypothetical protein
MFFETTLRIYWTIYIRHDGDVHHFVIKASACVAGNITAKVYIMFIYKLMLQVYPLRFWKALPIEQINVVVTV